MWEGALIGRTVKYSFMIAHRRPLALRAKPRRGRDAFRRHDYACVDEIHRQESAALLRGRAQVGSVLINRVGILIGRTAQ